MVSWVELRAMDARRRSGAAPQFRQPNLTASPLQFLLVSNSIPSNKLYMANRLSSCISTMLKTSAPEELCTHTSAEPENFGYPAVTANTCFAKYLRLTTKPFSAKYLHHSQQNIHLILVNSCKHTYINWIISHFLHRHLLWQ